VDLFHVSPASEIIPIQNIGMEQHQNLASGPLIRPQRGTPPGQKGMMGSGGGATPPRKLPGPPHTSPDSIRTYARLRVIVLPQPQVGGRT
jgi:hypothetical protein